MGIKKRASSSSEVVGEAVDEQVQVHSGIGDKNVVSLDSSNKKLKKEKKRKEPERENDSDDVPSTSHNNNVAVSEKPMERRKKRRALDKLKHHAGVSSDNKVTQMALDAKENVAKSNEEASSSGTSSGNSVLPEFHIGVFKDLALADAKVREAAAEVLVTELQAVQKAYDKLENKEEVEGTLKLEAQKDDGLNNCAPSVRYAVRRLVRGVSSSRECARQGFALGLTMLVGAVPSIKVDSLLKLIVNLLEVSSSMKGQEARDCLLGRLFAYAALARSGRLTSDLNLNKKSSCIKEFISALISLASKKQYLQEPAVSVILELVEKLPIKALVDDVLEVPGLQEWFDSATERGNPDALLLALKIREKIGIDHSIFGKLLPSEYSPNKLFSVDTLTLLANCLKESTFCQPRVHSVWPVLVNILLPDRISQDVDLASPTNSSKKHKKGRKCSLAEEDTGKNLQCFVEVIIEGSLLVSSHDRKHLAFDILLLLFPKLPTSCIHIVLSYKFIQCLVDVLSAKDSWLHKVAQHFLTELIEWVKVDEAKRIAVIMALQKHTNGRFDSITRTKVVKDLMAGFESESGCLLFVQELMHMFLDERNPSEEPSDQSQTTDDNSEIGSVEDKESVGVTGSSEFLKSWVIDSLPSVSKLSKLDSEARFRVQKEILKFLAVQGLFCSSLGTEVTSFELQEKFRWPKSAISGALSRTCIEQLELLFANVQKGEGPRVVAGASETSDLGSYFVHFLGILCNIPSVSLFRTLNEDDEKAFKKLLAMEAQLLREERNCGVSRDANKLHALRYLLIQLLLQILLRPGEYHEASVELIICCKRSFGTSDIIDSSGEDDLNEDGAPDVMDVLVDTMLSLLPQSSAPLRSAIEQVFKYFSNDITEDGLMRMLRVIKKDLKPARHQDSGSEDDDEDEDDLLDIEEAEESDESETGETGDTDEHTDDSEAVGGVETGISELPENSDDSDSGMDDDAMFRMDTYLARIFKERKNQAGGETAQSQLVLFKLRVLSLLEIFLHENPGNPQVLKVLSNLAQVLVNPHTSEQLGQRIWGILQRNIFKVKDKFPRGEAVQLSVLESLLGKNLKLAAKPLKKNNLPLGSLSKKQLASRDWHKMINTLGKESTLWILKVMDARSFSVVELQGVLEIFKGILNSYFDSKKNQMKSEFLKEIFRRRTWIGHNLLGYLLEKCCGAKSEFRRVEALDLIAEVLRSYTVTVDAGNENLRNHLPQIYDFMKELVTNMPEKHSRRADLRKFCAKVFQILQNQNLMALFLESLGSLLGVVLEKGIGAKSEFHAKRVPEKGINAKSECLAKLESLQIDVLDMVIEILRSLTDNVDEGSTDASRNILRNHLPQIYHLIKDVVTNMEKDQSRRADVRKSCGKVFQILNRQNLMPLFLNSIEPDVRAACQSHLGDVFLAFEK
ncbi:OLC1v1002776C1 [Oldenlandia corymbosa var. corymbosa]|uniref:OLC1v1002776C1 n=1 Tax=Oldenlandia corymbosa var. corymbosa TaxID=529605 RepID=A0AAV1D938_OLDCO|nr:OLC1v1002776C1 [Oldenlandia corymbosa var. corymbosa]